MKLDIYIINQGTPESKLLSRAGLDRMLLPVEQWKGRRISRGGYGKRPVAWRLEGEEQIKSLCEAVVSIIGSKAPEKRSSEEEVCIIRAKKMLKAFEHRKARTDKSIDVAKERESIIRIFLMLRYCSATVEEIDSASSALSKESHRTIEELMDRSNKVLLGKLSIWQEAKRDFIKVMN